MQYTKFKPGALLAPFVECYYHWEGVAAEPLTVQSPPNGFGAIVFNNGAPYQSSQNSNIQVPIPKAFVSGQFTSNYRLHLHGTISNIGAVLRPATVHNFFSVRMSHLVNTRISLDYLAGIDGDSLWNEMNTKLTVSDRVAFLEEFLGRYVSTGKSNLSIIDEAIEHIDSMKGCVTVDSVATHLRISRRYLEKKFLEKVGISPKYYARIKRFSILSNEIAHTKRIDWQHIVSQYGFHDQSHLVKEFLEFNQMNPTQYHMLHSEMVRIIKN
ncbi:helix-turn-helix domain-containing protein [Chryseolinea sp. T2]|uniref:helix-turn-helix domain-containing protein n=1 Tax=Chryseolinea sp. T2 TaxID=3129255 RepID=UPI003078564C